METVQTIYQTAVRCAQVAIDLCLGFRAETVQASRKVDKTWVTEADQSIEAKLREIILTAHPSHAILGEEHGGDFHGDEGEGYTWILDPIDGTFSFIHGIPFYSSLIAVLKGRTPIIGIACLPGMGITMSALKGHGVFVNGEPYQRPRLLGSEAVEIVATADPYRFRLEGHEGVFSTLYGEPFKARTYPDALGYYLLLQGSVRAFVDPKVEIWDVAPFHVILPEAGFAIRPWTASPGLQRGTSVAYPLDASGQPLACADVLAALAQS